MLLCDYFTVNNCLSLPSVPTDMVIEAVRCPGSGLNPLEQPKSPTGVHGIMSV